MNNSKKRGLCFAVILVCLVIGGVRIAFFNHYSNVNYEIPYEYLEVGQWAKIATEDNVGNCVLTGYEIMVSESDVLNTEEFLSQNGLGTEYAGYMNAKKQGYVRFVVRNTKEEAGEISVLEWIIHGIDFCGYVNQEATIAMNPEVSAEGKISILAQEEKSFVAVYQFSERYFNEKTWKNLEKEPLWIQVFGENKIQELAVQ